MNVLILGGGGREHALAVAVAASPKRPRMFTVPGNAGTAQLGTNLTGILSDLDQLVALAREHAIDFTIVGPEAPLCAGVVDAFESEGLAIFGPRRAAARIEGDKAYAKELMRRSLVPTAEARIFDDHDAARTYVATRETGLVVKASGLAGGKGVVVCDDPSEAILALERIMVDRQFGPAGDRVLVEERLTGAEVSVHALVDGDTIFVLDTARDYKRAGDGDSGPNTGGMGAISPAPGVDDALMRRIESQILVPIVDAMRGDGVTYQGVLYAGLMLTAAGPKVLEFNCRFGDPETQVILPRMDCDVLEVLMACAAGRLADVDISWKPSHAVCVVIAAEGYPGRYRSGDAISGLDDAATVDAACVYHAQTSVAERGCNTAGGRVLGVSAQGPDAETARSRAYDAAERIRFSGAWFRHDIAR